MRILVIGSGGREHAICWSFSKSPRVTKIFCADGNAGIADLAECVTIKPHEIDKLANFASENKIDLTFVGGETSLALGVSDEFERRGLKIVGPSASAARLEASKIFAKEFMERHSIPTARFVAANSAAEAIHALNSRQFGSPETPVVVKADGLAAGKGVVVASNRAEAVSAIQEMASRVGAEAASHIVLEECLFGREVSLLMFTDGANFALMPPTRDHKRIGEGDTGPNTGGMGTITDSGLLTDSQTRTIAETIIEPTLIGCRDEGLPFRGILFLGLMMTESGPKLLEYNVRFGDPETQSILVRLETDLVDICEAMLAGTLDRMQIEWHPGNSATIVLASKGYPDKPQTGDVIRGLDDAAKHHNLSIFHAGTSRNSNAELTTAGGRVLGVTALADGLENALGLAYDAVDDISWNGMQYRRDIGK
ncbi:MAG: phosphoribosylamine--glycine ligase [Acidobacteriota bacterium]